MDKTILFIDFNNLAIRGLFSDSETFNNPNPIFDQHKHVILNMLFFNLKKFSPDEVIIAIDSKMNWRKRIYAEYKANRKDKRDKDVFPWDQYYAYIDSFIEEMKEVFPFKFFRIPYAEADDIIAILARHLASSINIIVTTDADYIQLLQSKNIRLYDPIKKQYVIDKEPGKTLQVKIISGDKSDNIPGIKQRVGEKTAMKLIDTGELDTLLKEEEYKKLYERNRRLIDWNFIPDALKKEALKRYDEYGPINSFNTMKVMKFLVKHHLRKHTEDLSIIGHFLKPLTKQTGIKTFF